MPQPTPEQRQAAIDALRQHVKPNLAAARQALLGLYRDSYAAGALATAQQIPGAALVGNLGGVYTDAKSGWDRWEPGNVDAALKLDGPGFQQLLDSADATIQGVTGTALDRMGSLLAEGALNGDSVDTIAKSLMSVLDDPARAFTIADTELARATSAASADMYDLNGIQQWDWLLSPDACDICVEEGDGNPHPLGDDMPPAHPRCRCSSAPIDPTLASRSDIAGVASALVADAQAAEPALTATLSELAAANGGEMAGLANSVKGVSSLARKIASDVVDTGASPEDIASRLFDVNRYTTVFPDEQYASAAQAAIDTLRAQGETLKVKNYWNVADNPYQGINVQATRADGQRYELQFHTPTSLQVKEGDLHTLYEEQRVSSDPARIAELSRQMQLAADAIPVPPDVAAVE